MHTAPKSLPALQNGRPLFSGYDAVPLISRPTGTIRGGLRVGGETAPVVPPPLHQRNPPEVLRQKPIADAEAMGEAEAGAERAFHVAHESVGGMFPGKLEPV